MFKPNALDQFIGTEHYHRSTFGRMKLTDGVFYIYADGAGWLIDAIESYQSGKIKNIPFQIWELKKTGNTAVLTMKEDTNEPVLVEQKLEYTDFPMDEIKIYLIDGVCLLPSEY